MKSTGNPILDAHDLFTSRGVKAVLVGGAAAILHGSAYVTQDIDFCCSWDRGNLAKVAEALRGVHPRFRVEGTPQGVPIPGGLTAAHLANGNSFSFITDIGGIDVRKSVDGIGSYEDVLAMAKDETFGSRRLRILSIDGLIRSKKAMRRPRDLMILPELEMMREAEAVRQGREPKRRRRQTKK